MRGRPRKYGTPEEAQAAQREQQRLWRLAHRPVPAVRVRLSPEELRRRAATRKRRWRLANPELALRLRRANDQRVRLRRASERALRKVEKAETELALRKFRLAYTFDMYRIHAENRPFARRERNRRTNQARLRRSPEAIKLRRRISALKQKMRMRRGSRNLIARLFVDQQGCCALCRSPFSEGQFEIDHKIPLSRGGDNADGNIHLVCTDCNRRKGTMTLQEFVSRET